MSAETWPEGVVGRYQTVGGGTVDLRWYDTQAGRAVADCTGCGRHFWQSAEGNIRRDAQSHAESCRALPKPGGAR